MKKIIVGHGHSSIEVLHSLAPLVSLSNERKEWVFKFIDYKLFDIFKESGDLLILVRKYHNYKHDKKKITNDFLKLKNNFNKIIYFDDSASPSSIQGNILPFVDKYWKRAVFSDLNLYKKNFYGGRLFSDYYNKNYKIYDKARIQEHESNTKIDFSKIQIAWNIGVGIYPLNEKSILDKYYPIFRRFISASTLFPGFRFIHKILIHNVKRMKNTLEKDIKFDKKLLKFSARFDYKNYSNTVGFQRKLILGKIKNNYNFLTGFLKREHFISETHKVFGTLSPFGWGEICYRDFEALIGGSFLIKPDVSHISTWPNIFKKNMYHPISWNMQDIDNLDKLFDNAKACEISVNSSRKEYLHCLNNMVQRCNNLIEDVI